MYNIIYSKAQLRRYHVSRSKKDAFMLPVSPESAEGRQPLGEARQLGMKRDASPILAEGGRISKGR